MIFEAENIWESPLVLNSIWSLQNVSIPIRDFLYLVIVGQEISPRYGNDKKKVFWLTVVNWGCLMSNLFLKAKESFTVNLLNVIEGDWGTKNFASL